MMRHVPCSVAEVHDAHVKGHSGVLGNEIADKFAKLAAKQAPSHDILPLWPGRLLRHDLRHWAWLVLSKPSDLPTLFAFESEASRLQQQDRPAPPPPAPGATLLQPKAVEICLTAVSYNALTLLGPGSGSRAPSVGFRFLGRRDLVKAQLREMKVHLVGIQETRLKRVFPRTSTLSCYKRRLRTRAAMHCPLDLQGAPLCSLSWTAGPCHTA